MSVLYAVSFFLSEAVRWSWIAAQAVSIVMGIWALVDSLMRPAEYYAAAGKSTKRFWNVVNAAGTAVVGLLGAASMFGLLGVVASAVYLVDVRPALQALAPVKVRSSIRIPGRASQRRPGRGGRGPRDWSAGR
nr:DUF2516 family protein [uncultured Actinomyces sp.]